MTRGDSSRCCPRCAVACGRLSQAAPSQWFPPKMKDLLGGNVRQLESDLEAALSSAKVIRGMVALVGASSSY